MLTCQMWRHFQWNEPHITEYVRKFWCNEIPLWWFPDPTLKLNNSGTAWPIPAICISFSSILNVLSYQINLFSRCSSPLIIATQTPWCQTASSTDRLLIIKFLKLASMIVFLWILMQMWVRNTTCRHEYINQMSEPQFHLQQLEGHPGGSSIPKHTGGGGGGEGLARWSESKALKYLFKHDGLF